MATALRSLSLDGRAHFRARRKPSYPRSARFLCNPWGIRGSEALNSYVRAFTWSVGWLRCVVEGVGWFGAVGASGGAGPFQFVVADVDDVPAGLVFDAVVASA